MSDIDESMFASDGVHLTTVGNTALKRQMIKIINGEQIRITKNINQWRSKEQDNNNFIGYGVAKKKNERSENTKISLQLAV